MSISCESDNSNFRSEKQESLNSDDDPIKSSEKARKLATGKI